MIHRDIKPGNILFMHKNDISSLKICDLGLATNLGTGLFDQNYEQVGTLMYQSPEQMNESPSYGKPVDIWAIGMIMYELLTKGGHPLLGELIHKEVVLSADAYKDIMINNTSKFVIMKNLKSVSKHAKSLIKNLCNLRPNYRYNCLRALKHPWITRDQEGKVPLNFLQELQMNLEQLV